VKNYKSFINLFAIIYVSIFTLNVILFQINLSNKTTDVRPKEIKNVLNWIENNTKTNAHFMTIDSMLLQTIPTLTGRYNYIPSMKTLNPTDINEVIIAINETKKMLGIKNSFYDFINSSCKNSDSLNLYKYKRICGYFFHGYFLIDKGSWHYKKLKNEIPINVQIPEKNIKGERLSLNYINWFDEKFTPNQKRRNIPYYIIVGPAERKFSENINVLDGYQIAFSSENYKILKIEGQ